VPAASPRRPAPAKATTAKSTPAAKRAPASSTGRKPRERLTTPVAPTENDRRALELRRAGVPVQRIMDELGCYKSAAECEAGIVLAMRDSGVASDPLAVRDLELDRLDRIQQAVWVKAVKGDVNAIDRVLKLAELRMKLAGVAQTGVTVMVDAYDEAVRDLELKPADLALVAAGRRLAERIDSSGATGDSTAETKALYLVPHLTAVLRELGATPAARAALTPKGSGSGKSAKLTALRGGRSAAAGE
jgi:arginine repressor